MRIKINLSQVNDWNPFHDVFTNVLGFPGFYGRNMDAWIDCMSYIDDPNAGMSSLTVAVGETLEIELTETEQFMENRTEIFQEFVLCSAFVNQRFIAIGSPTRIALIVI